MISVRLDPREIEVRCDYGTVFGYNEDCKGQQESGPRSHDPSTVKISWACVHSAVGCCVEDLRRGLPADSRRVEDEYRRPQPPRAIVAEEMYDSEPLHGGGHFGPSGPTALKPARGRSTRESATGPFGPSGPTALKLGPSPPSRSPVMSLRPFGADRVEARTRGHRMKHARSMSLRPFGADRVEANTLVIVACASACHFGPSGPTALKLDALRARGDEDAGGPFGPSGPTALKPRARVAREGPNARPFGPSGPTALKLDVYDEDGRFVESLRPFGADRVEAADVSRP